MSVRILALLALGSLLMLRPAASDEALLRQAWHLRGKQSAAVLAEAGERFAALTQRWPEDAALRADPGKDPDVRWFLAHAMPAYLTLDSELAKPPDGATRSVALSVAAQLRWRNLGQYLPELLQGSKTDAERLEVLACMGALRDRDSVLAMKAFLRTKAAAREELAVAAVRGLGHTRLPDQLEAVNAARAAFKTPSARLAGSEAAFLCGDAAALAEIGQALQNTQLPESLRLEAVRVLCENFSDEALSYLCSAAVAAPSEALAVRALEGAIAASGYGQAPPETPPAGEQPDAAERPVLPSLEEPTVGAGGVREPPTGDPQPAPPSGIDELSPEQRTELAAQVRAWWAAEGRDQADKRRRHEVY